MATELGSQLPPELVAALTDPECENLAVPLVTTDRQGYPHVAMLSFLEILPHRANRFAFFLQPGSRTAGFLQRNKICTLVFASEHFTYYLKGNANFVGTLEGVVAFIFSIQTTLQDHPSQDEAETSLSSGLRFRAPARELERRRALRARVASQLGTPFSGK